MRGRSYQARRTRAKHAPIAHVWPPIGQHTHKTSIRPPHPLFGRSAVDAEAQVMTRSWSWRRVGARSAAGSSPTSSAGAVRRHLSMEVRRCDSNSSQIASLTALDPSLVRRRWLILSSPAVQLTLTRLPPRSVPPPPIPCAPSAARTARFPPPPPNPAPAEPAEPPLSIWPSLCARGGSSLHATLPSNPGAPPPPLTRELNSVCLLSCR